MFRPVRKKKNEISTEAAKQLLHTERRGVFAVNGDDGYPYAIPVNFFYDEEANQIYFHGARAGHKIDAIRACDKVCFTVYGNETVRDEAWAPYMRSAVVFGRCRLPEYSAETLALLKRFAMKYYPEESMVDAEIAAAGKAAQMYVIDIEHISGKDVQERLTPVHRGMSARRGLFQRKPEAALLPGARGKTLFR